MRNAEFDREKVLRAAMIAFTLKGYGKTSMQDLTKATGLHPGSIYCAFDNKRGLLLAAIEQYQLDKNAEFDEFFNSNQMLLQQLKAYLDNIVMQCQSSEANQACLMIKALNEIAQQDSSLQQIIADNLAQMQQALADKFAQAKLSNELTTKRDSEHLAGYFLMGIYGLRTYAQTHPNTGVLQQLADQLYHDVCVD
jgi:TetR/AcrR family transcriptional repressor of nem operon